MGVHCLEIVQGLNVGENMSKCACLKKPTTCTFYDGGRAFANALRGNARLCLGGDTAKALWAKLVFRMGGLIWNGLHMLARRFGAQLDRKREEQIRHLYVYDFEIGTLQGGCKSWDNFSQTHTWAQRCSCLFIMNTRSPLCHGPVVLRLG